MTTKRVAMARQMLTFGLVVTWTLTATETMA